MRGCCEDAADRGIGVVPNTSVGCCGMDCIGIASVGMVGAGMA